MVGEEIIEPAVQGPSLARVGCGLEEARVPDCVFLWLKVFIPLDLIVSMGPRVPDGKLLGSRSGGSVLAPGTAS